jgi:hypothetical protein
MIILMFIIIIGIIVLARVFSRSRGKDGYITMPINPYKRPNSYPSDDPHLTNPAFSAFGNNRSHFIFWHHWND